MKIKVKELGDSTSCQSEGMEGAILTRAECPQAVRQLVDHMGASREESAP